MQEKVNKEAFYYLMDLVSDLYKNTMMDMLLEASEVNVSDFFAHPYHIHPRDVYGNLHGWVQSGLVSKREDRDTGSFSYCLEGVVLLNRLGGGTVA